MLQGQDVLGVSSLQRKVHGSHVGGDVSVVYVFSWLVINLV